MTFQTNQQHSDDLPLVPNHTKLTLQEIKVRLDWVNTELTQLSTSAGVSERLHALRHFQSQLAAQHALMIAMGK